MAGNPREEESALVGKADVITAEQQEKESAERNKFLMLYVVIIFVVSPIFAWGSYVGMKKLVPGQDAILQRKFVFIHENQLGYVFLSWIVVWLTRSYLTVNSNGARKPTDLDRPDQHIYETADGKAVKMAVAGVEGRFNRAQRATYNMDETLPMFITGLLLNAAVYGPLALVLAFISMFGRITFGNKYKQATNSRGAGFMPSIVAESWSMGLVCVSAIIGMAGPDAIPI